MKKLKTFLKRIILSLAAAAFLLSFGDYTVYADSSSETPGETLESLPEDSYSAEEQVFIDSASDDTDKDLRTLSVEVVRATSSTYSLDDVYNLLISVYTTYTGRASWAVFDQTIRDLIINDFRHYDSNTDSTYDVGAMLWSIRNVMIALQDQFVPATALSSPSMYQLVDAINETLSLALVDSNNTPYLVNIYNKLIDIASGHIDYTSALFYNSVGVAEYASRINSAIVASYNGLHTKLGVLDNIDSKLSTTNSTLNIKLTSLNTHAQTIEGKIDNQTQTLSSDLSSSGAIASVISNFDSDYNNINWKSSSVNLLGIVESVGSTDYIDYTNLVTNKHYYFKLSSTFGSNSQGVLLKITLPYYNFVISNPITIHNVFTYHSHVDSKILSYSSISSGTLIYVLFPHFWYSDGYIYVEFSFDVGRLSFTNSFVSKFEYLVQNDKDFVDFSKYIIQFEQYDFFKNNNDILNIFKELYASDDLIAAKENQQSYENQALSDFTGSGSAAASGSDLGNIKDVSSTLKDGLPNQGSVSNALNIFNPNSNLFSDLWAWFSQENYNNINNPSLRTRDSQIVNFLSQNEEYYYRYLYEGSDTR